MLVLNKDLKTIQNNTEDYFKKVGISTTPGSISKLFSSVINKEISEFYEQLSYHQRQAFLSTSTGKWLDDIGMIVNCKRKEKEADDDYRYRISKQVLYTASANIIAVKNAALEVTGVDNVVVVPFTRGSGSFDLFVVSNEGAVSEKVINEVKVNVLSKAAYGVNIVVSEPKYKTIELKLKILFKNKIQYIDKDEIAERIRINVFAYINSLAIGQEFLTNQITSVIMQTNDNIANYVCEEFRIDGKKCPFRNQYLKKNEKFIIRNTFNSITIS